MYNLPLRRTTLHLAQRFLIDGETFIVNISLHLPRLRYTAKGIIILFHFLSVQHNIAASGIKDSQDQRIAFGDSHTMFKVCRQRSIYRNNSPLVGQNACGGSSHQNHRFERDG